MMDPHAVLDTDKPLTLLDTNAPERVLEALRQCSLREGSIVYRWTHTDGLFPIQDPGMRVAGTESLAAAIQTLEQQRYRSVCVIDSLDGVDFGLLQQLSWKGRIDKASGFSVLLLLPEHSLPEGLLRVLHVLHWQQPERITPRLRNGQWLR